MLTRLSSKVVAGATAAVLVGGSTLLVAGSASAAVFEPGDTETVGAAATLTLSIGDIVVAEQDTAFGVLGASVPGQDYDLDEDVTLLDAGVPGLADLTADSVEAAVQSTPEVAQAMSAVTGTSLNFLGLPVLGLEHAGAEVQCTPDEGGLAALQTTGFTVFGIPVTIDDDNPLYEATADLGDDVQVGPDADDVADLSDLDLTVRVAQVREGNAYGAASIALAVQLILDGTIATGTPDEEAISGSVAASLILAEAACLTPLSLTAISPATGSTAGGEKVVLTGTGFPEDAAVTFGGVPATVTDRAVDGTSITVSTPVHAAGAVDVTVTTEAGQTATLPYTYVAPVVPVVPASTGTTTLAATGADPAPALGLGAGILVLGLGALVATAAVRRRRA